MKPKVKILALIVCLLAIAAMSQSAWVRFAWDQSPDPFVNQYNLYWGPGPVNYTNHVTANGLTNTTATVSNLVYSAGYHFAVTAQDSFGQESKYSTEVVYSVPPPVPQNLRVTGNSQ